MKIEDVKAHAPFIHLNPLWEAAGLNTNTMRSGVVRARAFRRDEAAAVAAALRRFSRDLQELACAIVDEAEEPAPTD